ncbi:MAG: tetratricopeptide repeat protein [Thalassotalea sp.]
MKVFIVMAALIVLTGCSATAKNGGLSRVIANYDDGDYQESIYIANRIMRTHEYDQSSKAMILYYKALSLAALNRQSEATGIYRFLEKNYPETEYGFIAIEKLKVLPEAKPLLLPTIDLVKGTRANEQLFQDASIGLRAKLALSGCKEKPLAVQPYIALAPSGETGLRFWTEVWSVFSCNEEHRLTVNFKEDGKGSASYIFQ